MSRATIEDYPFAAALMRNGVHICGAVILGERWLVTARHCIVNQMEPTSQYEPEELYIIVGRERLVGATQEEARRVEEVVIRDGEYSFEKGEV